MPSVGAHRPWANPASLSRCPARSLSSCSPRVSRAEVSAWDGPSPGPLAELGSPLHTPAAPSTSPFPSLRCRPEPVPCFPLNHVLPAEAPLAGLVLLPPTPFHSQRCWVLTSAVLCLGTQTLLGGGWSPCPVMDVTQVMAASQWAAGPHCSLPHMSSYSRALPCQEGRGGRHPFREDQLISHLTGFPSERPSLWARGGPCIQALAGVPLTPAGAPVSGSCDSLATCPGRPQVVCLAGGPCDEVVRTAPGALRPELGRD